MTSAELTGKPYKQLDNAFLDAQSVANSTGETFHIIYTHGIGFEVVPAGFVLDRLYYHSGEGQKMFFDFKETVTPKPL